MSLIEVKEDKDAKAGSHAPRERELEDYAPVAVTPPTVAVATLTEGHPPRTRRSFAAKYHHRGWGVALGFIGVLSIIVGLGGGLGGVIVGIIVGLIPLAISVYLLRGHGVDPKIALQKAAKMAAIALQKAAKMADIAQRKATEMGQATAALQAAAHAGQRGAAAVAYRNLRATAERLYLQEAQARIGEAMASLGLDARSLESPQIGVISSLPGRGQVEVFRDWIIYGREAHDVDATTRGEVHVDGSVQVTSQVVADGTKSRVQTTQHDMRTAQVQFVSSTWSMGVAIHPDRANDARLVVARLAANVESLKPQGVTGQEIRAMVDIILNNTGQPAAEKLQQLSNLRYQRLLSDEEFEQAKSKILGIG
jgi:hypothetical protein